jgi:hypothetical protein
MDKNLEQQLNADLGLTIAWLEDTLRPAINLMNLKALIYEIDADIKTFEEKNGKSKNTEKSSQRANKMIELIESLDKICTQNNTFQLVLKHQDLKMNQLLHENNRLKSELEAVNKAFNEL